MLSSRYVCNSCLDGQGDDDHRVSFSLSSHHIMVVHRGRRHLPSQSPSCSNQRCNIDFISIFLYPPPFFFATITWRLLAALGQRWRTRGRETRLASVYTASTENGDCNPSSFAVPRPTDHRRRRPGPGRANNCRDNPSPSNGVDDQVSCFGAWLDGVIVLVTCLSKLPTAVD